jgi:hypothetical protein
MHPEYSCPVPSLQSRVSGPSVKSAKIADGRFARRHAENRRMKLWELRRVSETIASGFGEATQLIGVMVRADTEAQARVLAGRESRRELGDIWMDDKLTTCAEIEPLADGNAGVVLSQWIGSTLAGSQAKR